MSKIIYTRTDEAPALATYSLLPVIQQFAGTAGVDIETRDISLAARILSQFPDYLSTEQKVHDALAELGELVQRPEANIIKLPNISASIPQIKRAVSELQAAGFAVPDYPDEPQSDTEREIRKRYDRVKGSAVNPVLREGNSDRRAPRAVKNYAKKHPHSMGEWTPESRSVVASMSEGDFYGSEESVRFQQADSVQIEFHGNDGSRKTLKPWFPMEKGEILDAARMSRKALRDFLKKEIRDAKEAGVLFSIHLKATMMKVSDPIIFGHGVSVFFEDVFSRYGEDLHKAGVNPNNGLGDLLARLDQLPESKRQEILDSIENALDQGPELAMVDSDNGITNLHVPSDVIIDASMPAAIRAGGKMWAPDGSQKDMKAVIPDRSYAGVYAETIEHCKKHGAFDPRTMGSVSNVGLMAQKAEEYGSHDKTFEIPESGNVVVRRESDEAEIFRYDVEEGDIFRMCQVKEAAVSDWVKLAVNRGRESGVPVVFWLDGRRAHDSQLIKRVENLLPHHDTDGLEIYIMPPVEAARYSLDVARAGKDCIAVTGNVLRDYLTDLFPILELGTSAKMLSIVPLMNDGGLFETGAGGSAPKHVQQFVKEGHLRWDSLGEFLALGMSLKHLGRSFDNPRAIVLGDALDAATEKLLDNNKSPRRKVHELDNRGSHYYLAMYWAEALAENNDDPELARRASELARKLEKHEQDILRELDDAQGAPVEIGGYFYPEQKLASRAMRPSETFNRILAEF
ncbi:NADP-dependent isocitrate dehydrogenase [Salinispira pacifica]|uniref:Isocitrate dehydrogenase [NADP] n=1 Tax=Salinispira pacifica TaxID=1307761 RepID=V5WJE7_9SPIO|nr:NADP-dependent isocitrate dehydrogenase [Salinispira pacifica]AHC15760.1 Isocitrate dehydrogenase (NADP) [Salinispira pacifica]